MTTTIAPVRPDPELLVDPAHADVIAELRAGDLPDTDIVKVLRQLPTARASTTTVRAVLDGGARLSLAMGNRGTYATWSPYLDVMAEGMPDTCPCSCLACSQGPCTCTAHRHAAQCVPETGPMGPCTARFAGVGAPEVKDVTVHDIQKLAWWTRRRGLQRTVVRNAHRATRGEPALRHDGRGASESAIAAARWLLTWVLDSTEDVGLHRNVARRVKTPRRPERSARSVSVPDFVELYRVAMTTGRDPEGNGLILRHLLIQGVRRGGLLGLRVDGLDDATCTISFHDQKRESPRSRPTTRAHLKELQAHAVQRGPRVMAPAGAPARERYEGTTLLADDDPVFYRMPIDTFDEEGLFVSRVTRPVTRKAVESLFTRVKRHLPWAMLHGLRPHDIRHTSSVIVYKASDHQLTQLHLAHDAANTTEHCLQESLAELAEVKEQLFGGADDAEY